MSLLGRIMPNALCCFHSSYHHDEDIQSSPLRPVQPTIPRKPMPYAMINVPHEPEMTDVYAFRRLFTQSPACPHEGTPISAIPNKFQPRDLVDLDYTAKSGSPVPATKKSSSIQKLSQHVKQKMSESRLSKSSLKADVPSRVEVKEALTAENADTDFEPSSFGMSARSTGLSDILRSREGSVDRYDNDAESIKTPHLLSPAETIRLVLMGSCNNVPAMSPGKAGKTFVIESEGTTPKSSSPPRARSLPLPETLEKTAFVDAVQQNIGESRDEMLKRLSLGFADGTIKVPTPKELELFSTPRTSIDMSKMHLIASHTGRTPDAQTPQTIVKRLSSRLEGETGATAGSKASNGRSDTLLESIDPALVEYIARSTPSRPLSSIIQGPNTLKVADVDPPAAQDDESDPGESTRDFRSCFEESHYPRPVATNSSGPSQAFKSVHLFDMHISKCLASKSQATFLSPTASGNTSKRSFALEASTGPNSRMNSMCTTLKPSGSRAEHNRRPSDPHTKQLFERAGDSAQPSWLRNSISTKSRLAPHERDDASSYYTYDADPPSSAGNLSSFDGTRSIKFNPNSIAIGGRAASYDLPSRRSTSIDKTKSRMCSAPQRSLSISYTQASDLLDRAASILARYTDGSVDDRKDILHTEPDTEVPATVVESYTRDIGTELSNPLAEKIAVVSQHNDSDWFNTGQKSGWNYDITRSSSPVERRHSAPSMIAPEVDVETNTESATDMWNRAYRTACDARKSQFLLSPIACDISYVRRISSVSTTRLRHRSDNSRDTLAETVRRSRSAEPRIRKAVIQDGEHVSPNSPRSLKKLSFLRLRGVSPKHTEDTVPRKLRKRSAPQLSKKSSFAGSKHSVSSMLQPGHTPSLKKLLGTWGAFPAHERAKRNGPAGEADKVHTRDFALHISTRKDADHSPEGTTPSRQFSAIRQALRTSPFRVSKSAKKESRSMSFFIDQRPSKSALRSKWNRLYRTKSSEWRGLMVGGGHRTSVSAGQLVEYPELETLPGEGFFGFRSRGSAHHQQHDTTAVDEEQSSHDNVVQMSSKNIGAMSMESPPPQVHTFWKPNSNASLAEPNRRDLTG